MNLDNLQREYSKSRRQLFIRDENKLPKMYPNRSFVSYPEISIIQCEKYKQDLSPVKFQGDAVVDESKLSIFSISKEKENFVKSVIIYYKPNITINDLHRVIFKLESMIYPSCKLKPNEYISKIINGLKQAPSLDFIIATANLWKLSVLYSTKGLSILYNYKDVYVDDLYVIKEQDILSQILIIYDGLQALVIQTSSLSAHITPNIKI